jgi:hypothetical protein
MDRAIGMAVGLDKKIDTDMYMFYMFMSIFMYM